MRILTKKPNFHSKLQRERKKIFRFNLFPWPCGQASPFVQWPVVGGFGPFALKKVVGYYSKFKIFIYRIYCFIYRIYYFVEK